ncbi:hypothetical protein IHV12_20200 [Fictibacillus sp. 7GRE50]|jgi:hypothetical protein|uniref:hypothetical protein n=1 Tax=Fictibacillus sp. 7GRE50 TaxID=2745878 RepID=UPI0018CF4A20|nr:hypothetical protein [Fictibacillus sp. 7GRE50]MBH0167249.1 hypothetical protein [Fictibacillus sp. 7GRE50]
MRAYSQVNIIGEELDRIEGSYTDSFLSKVIDRMLGINNNVFLTISMPSVIVIRSRTLCYDITKDIKVKFTQTHLLSALYEDFLLYLRKSNNNLHEIYNWLVVRDTSSVKINDYSLNNEVDRNGESVDRCHIKIGIDREDALRGENFLLDLEDFYPGHHFTLELILEIIFTDFINEYKQGNVKCIAQKLIKYTESKN